MESTPIWLIDSAWISFAFACGFIARMLNLPPLIGFLAAGFLLNGLGIREAGEALQQLADLGVTLLLFTIGLKFDVKTMKAEVLDYPSEEVLHDLNINSQLIVEFYSR